MASATGVPVEEYLKTTYEPDREYVDGQLVERHVGEYFHSRLQTMVGTLLSNREDERGFLTFTEQRVKVSESPRYRIPDICVKALPHEITPVLERPDLAIEIVSPDDAPIEMTEKIVEYLASGIPYVWVVDPYRREKIVADQQGIRVPPTWTFETPLVGPVDFGALLEKLYRHSR